MKVTKTQNDINFGFNYSTHRKIAQKLIEEEYPKLQKYAPIIKHSVINPDFDELGFHSNSHFYYPEKKLLRFRESFFDFDGMHNARAKYNEHIDKFFAASKYCRFSEMAEEAGRAKHFLDDMSVGLHVQRGNIFQKWRDREMHKRFEDYIYDNEDTFIANSKKSPVEFITDDLKNSEFPNNHNQQRWQVIAQNSVNAAMDASRVFLNKVSEFLP